MVAMTSLQNSFSVSPEPATPAEQALVPERSSVEVVVTLQPAELFVGNDGKVLDLACTDNYALVFRERNGKHGYVVYNEAGQIVTPTGDAFPKFSLTRHSLAQALKAANFQGVAVDSRYNAHGNLIARDTLAKRLNIPQARHGEFFEALAAIDPNVFYTTALADDQRKVFDLESDIKSDSTRNKLVFQRGNVLNIYLTHDEEGRVLHPEEWRLVAVKDNGKITATQLKNHPFLREFRDTQKGRLIGDTTLAVDNDRGILNVIDTEKNVRVYSDSSVGYALDPSDKKTIYYYNAQSRELKTFDVTQASLAQTPVTATKLQLKGTVKDFKLDPQGNFLLMIVEDESKKSSLHVLEKDTLALAATIPDIMGPIEMDNLGNIYFVDGNRKLRLAQTNFMTFPKGGIEQVRNERRERLLRLSGSIETLNLPPDERPKLAELPADLLDEERITRELRGQLRDRFTPMIEEVSTLDEVESLGRRISKVRSGDDFKQHPELFDEVEKLLERKESELRVADLRGKLEAYRGSVDAAHTIQEIIALDGDFVEISRSRRELVIKDPATRRAVDEQIRELDKLKTDKQSAASPQIAGLLGEKFESMKQVLEQATTLDELSDTTGDPAVEEFEVLIASVRDRSLSGSWKEQYRQYMIGRRAELQKREEQARADEMVRQAELIEEAQEVLAEIKKALADVADSEGLDRWRSRNPLVVRYRTKLVSLPADLREGEDRKLEELLRDRREELERRSVVTMPKEGGVIKFKNHEFPVFHTQRVVWQPKVVPSAPGLSTGTLVFKDSAGRVFTPECGPLPVNMNEQVTKDAVDTHRAAAESYFESRARKVPAFDSSWVLNDYNKDILDRMAKLARIQLERKRGILILEGEAGVGKNVNVDMLAHFSNRETFTFSCNYQSEKEDLTYAFKFDPARGTYQVDSRLLEMLQTPGSIIVLDEINTLPPGVLKMLNPLLDYRRTLYLPDGREIHADPSVIIVGTMNPQHYLGVKPLSPEVKSRARIMYIDYPPEKVGAKYAPYEAEILAKYVPELSGIGTREFDLLWNYVCNRDTSNGGDKYHTKQREQVCKELLQIVKTANRVREAYKAYRTGASNDPIDFVFSLRETIDIAAEMTSGASTRDAIEDVIIPKISDPAEKERVKAIVRGV